ELLVRHQGAAAIERRMPWPADVISLEAEHDLLKARKAKPGDSFSYRMYEPLVNTFVTARVTVGQHETLKLGGADRKLLKAEVTPDKLRGTGPDGRPFEIQLPPTTMWFDDDYNLVRSQTEMPGAGPLRLERTTKANALAPIGNVPDLGQLQSIVLN